MNDWMTSVADIPGDADDDLPEISPELVLVDPELARIVRERQPDGGRRALIPTLRLVPAVDEPAPIVPRATTFDEPQFELEPVLPSDAGVPPDMASEGLPEGLRTPEPSPLVRDVAEESRALVPALPRVVDAEPARIVEPLTAEPTRASPAAPEPTSLVSPADAPPPSTSPHLLPAAMPHPIARPERSHRSAGSSERPRRGRSWLAFVAAVAAASLMTLGILNLSDGSSSSAPETTAALSGGPSSDRSAAEGKGATQNDAATRPKTASTPKVASKAKAASKPKTASKAKVTETPKAPAKAKVTAKPETASTGAATTKPKAATKPTGTTKPKTKPAATAPSAKAVSTPKAQPATPKPAVEPRRFAWAPVDGAVSYHVELFRGADRVLAKETTEPILELGSTWRYDGKTVQLTPGSYRWYVWPVTKSGRATQAVVQAKLDIP
jgi:hypothetical protein